MEVKSGDLCDRCGGMCCSFRDMDIAFTSLEKGERYDSHFIDADRDHIAQLYFDDGGVPDMDWFVVDNGGNRTISFDCNHLTDDGKCGVYDRRPGMCQVFQCTAMDPDSDTTLAELKETHGRDGVPDDEDVREVTDRVREILRRREDEATG